VTEQEKIENRSQGEDPDMLPGTAGPKRISIGRVIGTVLSLGLFVYLIHSQSWDKLGQALSQVPLSLFILSVLLMFGSRICVSLRWYVLLRSAQTKINLWQALRLTFMGLFASNFLPTTVGGDLVRLAGAISYQMDAGTAAASLVVDRLVGMAGMSSLAPLGLTIVLRTPAGSGIVPTALAAGFFPRLARIPGVGWVYTRAEKFVRSMLHSSMLWLRHPSSLVWALLCTFGHMLFTFLSILVLLNGMHQSISFWWIGGLWSLNYFITTLVPISINGLGLQELSIAMLYTRFGGVSAEASLALAVFMRMLPLIASLPGGLFLPDILRQVSRKPSSAQP
jgi:uncharacterized membrane protein YbhN (UPF0104 family)